MRLLTCLGLFLIKSNFCHSCIILKLSAKFNTILTHLQLLHYQYKKILFNLYVINFLNYAQNFESKRFNYQFIFLYLHKNPKDIGL
jgi:hypothetical protein